jgi:F-type H+-transporting ATPase subunit b
MKLLARIAGALVVMLLASSGNALAASGEHHAPSWSLTLLGFVNFAIYAFILARFAWPPIRTYLQDRRDRVVEQLEAAAQARREAEALKAEFEARLRTVEREADQMRQELLDLASAEAAKLVEQARQTAARIRRDAQLVADQEVSRARQLLRAECAEMIASLASEIVARDLTADDQDRFVREFLQQTREAAR